VSNAIKFSLEGGKIRIETRASERGLDVLISDDGVGMATALSEKLFEDRFSTTRPGTDGEGGTGFGMPIARAYMTLYGGSISVEPRPIQENTENHGTNITLHFRVPDGERG
jgi:signal transduction histidine kinase